MTEPYVYGDVESAVKAWAITRPMAPLVTAAGRTHIYLAMPVAAPVPSLILSRVGGGARPTSDLPVDRARISFDCWGNSRAVAQTLSRTLMTELDLLGPTGGYTVGGVTLAVAEVLLWTWLPDPKADTARYVVDALITALPA